MDKNTYETYEFLAPDNEDSQFLVVQDDGTFLINRPIQYITQAQDVKAVLEEVEPCTVYDENSQQFFVNVNDNEELIADQFVVPNADNNVYTNGFFLQAIENSKDEQIKENISEYSEVPDNTAIEIEDKNTGDCTEITLSDEQYQLLQEKGWILLETNDKIYLLDSVGLHDITNNEKLIEKLRNDVDEQNSEEEVISSVENEKENDNNIKQEPVCYVATEDLMQVEEVTQEVLIEPKQNNKDYSEVEIKIEEVKNNDNILTLSQPNKEKSEKSNTIQLGHNPIKIKTKHLFKDIPPEIVLGKTVNGKTLVARVVKTNKPLCDTTLNKPANLRTPEQSAQCNTGLSEIKFESLIRQKLNDIEDMCTGKDITTAEIVVGQLLRVPAFRPVVMERQLVVTKTVILESAVDDTHRESTQTLVTGRVTHDGPEPRFTHVPDLLHKLLRDGEAILFFRRTKDVNEGSFLHIHVCERKGADGIVRMSITLNKRHLPLRLVSELKIRQSTVFACSSCATVFNNEDELKEHQEAECMDVDDALIIVTENTKNAYTVVNTGKEKKYVCNQCQMSFSKLNNCQKHVKTHFNLNNENDALEDNSNENKLERVVFKCKMCPSTYFHPATLSKHIVSKHIKVRTK